MLRPTSRDLTSRRFHFRNCSYSHVHFSQSKMHRKYRNEGTVIPVKMTAVHFSGCPSNGTTTNPSGRLSTVLTALAKCSSAFAWCRQNLHVSLICEFNTIICQYQKHVCERNFEICTCIQTKHHEEQQKKCLPLHVHEISQVSLRKLTFSPADDGHRHGRFASQCPRAG